MRHLILALVLSFALLAPLSALAQPVAPPPAEGSGVALEPVPEAVAVPAVVVPEVAPVAVPAPPPPTNEQLLADGKAAAEKIIAAAAAEKDAEGIQWVAWAGALAAFFTLLLGLLRRFGGLLLNEQKLRIATLALGLLAGLCASLALGAPDWAALVMAASGPGSMLVWAVVDLFRPGSWAKAQQREAEKKAASPLVP